jgi:hypothetical protein
MIVCEQKLCTQIPSLAVLCSVSNHDLLQHYIILIFINNALQLDDE